MAPKFIEIEGKRLLWKDVLQMRRAQVEAAKVARQPTLFELKDDARPGAERTAAGRFSEPTLLSCLHNKV